MIPMERLALERRGTEKDENDQSNNLLYHLELHQTERTTIVAKPDAIGRYLEAILEQSQKPTEQNDTEQRQMVEPADLLAHLQRRGVPLLRLTFQRKPSCSQILN